MLLNGMGLFIIILFLARLDLQSMHSCWEANFYMA